MTTLATTIPRPPVDQALLTVRAELDAFADLLRDLDPADWVRPTACPGWTVHDVVAHVTGQSEGMARPDRLIRRVRKARRNGGTSGILDRSNQYQVDARAGLSDEDLIAEFVRWGGKAVKAAGRIPAPMRRRMRMSTLFPEETKLLPEDSFDYLVQVLMASDIWMHRLDVTLAAGREPQFHGHEGTIVAQVVRDLDTAWTGPAALIELTGPAGGRWSIGPGSPAATLTADTVTYMRLLSGRPVDPPPAVTGDPAVADRLRGAHVEF
jgi:uncharacterized protein (TIGR03083 family)